MALLGGFIPAFRHHTPHEAVGSLWSQILAIDDLIQYTLAFLWLWLQPEVSVSWGCCSLLIP